MTLTGCPVRFGAGVEDEDAADLVRRAEPARLKLIELDHTIVGKRGTETIVEAVALAAGLAPHDVPAAVRPHLYAGRKPIRDVLFLTRAQEALTDEV